MSNNNFNDITKGKNTNIFTKMFRPLILFIINPVIVSLIISILIVIGVFKFLNHLDEKNYPYGDYELTYRVYYSPSNIKDYTVTHNRPIWVSSHRGSNEVYLYDKGTVIETSAPIEVVKYVNHIHK
jgi:hypothetical protein